MKIAIGKNVKVLLREPLKKGSGYKERVGKIVYIFPAFQIPDKDLIIKYYGEMVIDPKYASQFGPNLSDRVVIETDPNIYTILPMKGLGRYFQLEEI